MQHSEIEEENQTCMMSIQDENFEFTKVPCVVFSGEDSADLGGPRREFFRLLVQQGIKELGVFEGPRVTM